MRRLNIRKPTRRVVILAFAPRRENKLATIISGRREAEQEKITKITYNKNNSIFNSRKYRRHCSLISACQPSMAAITLALYIINNQKGSAGYVGRRGWRACDEETISCLVMESSNPCLRTSTSRARCRPPNLIICYNTTMKIILSGDSSVRGEKWKRHLTIVATMTRKNIHIYMRLFMNFLHSFAICLSIFDDYLMIHDVAIVTTWH